MSPGWPELSYERWRETRDTLHAHTQVLGKLAAVRDLGGPVEIDPAPQEVPWTVPLDADDVHAHYDPAEVSGYFTAATRAALVLAEYRAPTVAGPPRSTPGGAGIPPWPPAPTGRRRRSASPGGFR